MFTNYFQRIKQREHVVFVCFVCSERRDGHLPRNTFDFSNNFFPPSKRRCLLLRTFLGHLNIHRRCFHCYAVHSHFRGGAFMRLSISRPSTDEWQQSKLYNELKRKRKKAREGEGVGLKKKIPWKCAKVFFFFFFSEWKRGNPRVSFVCNYNFKEHRDGV